MTEITDMVDEAKDLAAQEDNSMAVRAKQIQTLAQEFIQNRLENTKGIEGAKTAAITKLVAAIPDITSPTQLLRIIKELSAITGVDLELLSRGSGGGGPKGGQGGNSFSFFFETPKSTQTKDGVTQYQDGSLDIPKSVYQLADLLSQIAETIDYNKPPIEGETNE